MQTALRHIPMERERGGGEDAPHRERTERVLTHCNAYVWLGFEGHLVSLENRILLLKRSGIVLNEEIKMYSSTARSIRSR